MGQVIQVSNLPVAKKYTRLITALFFSIAIYLPLNVTFSIYPLPLIRLLQVAVLILFLYSLYHLVNLKFRSSYFNKILVAIIIWNITIVIRFNDLSTNEFYNMAFLPIHFLTYIVPFFSLIAFNRFILLNLKRTICIFCLIFIVTCSVLNKNINATDYYISTLGTGACFIILNYRSNKNWENIICLITIFLALYFGVIGGRRSIIITYSMVLLLGYFNYSFSKYKDFVSRCVHLGITLLILYLLAHLFIVNWSVDLSVLDERAFVDSRTDVYKNFFHDLSLEDMVFGRGIDGTYKDEMFYWSSNDIDNRWVTRRDNIENGFLFMILKGGVISLLLFLALLIPAIIKGLFTSKNALGVAFSLYLLVYLVDMFSFGQQSFSMKYFIVWIGVGYIYNKR